MSNIDKQCKRCRREGKKLFLKSDRCYGAKCAIVKRNYPPGIHGAKARGKRTSSGGYGAQLREKQIAKRIYGLREKQFANYFKKAMRQVGDTGEALLRLLEMRLDNVLFRAGFTKSRKSARQLAGHGYFQVNGKRVDIPSRQLKIGDKIILRENKINKKVTNTIKDTLREKKHNLPDWLKIDKDKMEIMILSKPKITEADQIFNIKMIVEFYSK